MNNIKKMTEAAMLSALFVVVSILIIGGGIFYSLYLDTVVPIIVALIYLKCGKRYSILSSLVSLIIIIFVIGNVAIGILMSQSMILGLICGFMIEKNTSIFDDLFISAIVSCLIMVSIDILFSNLTGYSFLTEFKGYMEYIDFNEDINQAIYCILVATLPLGTMMITYFASILLGKKLKLLSHNGKKKFVVIRNFKRIGFLSYCSKTTTIVAVVYIFVAGILNEFDLSSNYIRLGIIVTSIEYISLYFVLKDCYGIISSYIFMKTKSKLMYLTSEMVMFYMLISRFKIAVASMITMYVFIDIKEKYTDKQSEKLENIIMRLI